jgi:hypothetical protein
LDPAKVNQQVTNRQNPEEQFWIVNDESPDGEGRIPAQVRVKFQRQGRDSTSQGVPEPGERDRYLLG